MTAPAAADTVRAESKRRLGYNVAMRLDGCTAGSNGEHDWIPFDATIDYEAPSAEFDTFVVGRRTYEAER